MNYINELLAELTARLPELEWKLSGLRATIPTHSVPRGLFRSSFELTGSSCVEEIKSDIRALSQQRNERSALYLADRIKQKVNVLVALCQMDNRKHKTEEKNYFGVKMLSTRQQWILSLEKDITTLSAQQKAMTKALEQMKPEANSAVVLNLKKELGEVERRLTLAKETLNQATSSAF